MPRVCRVVTSTHRSKVTNAAVQVEHGSGVGLKRPGEEWGEVEAVDLKVDAFVKFQRTGRVVHVDEPNIFKKINVGPPMQDIL